jgi:hypothetical protein
MLNFLASLHIKLVVGPFGTGLGEVIPFPVLRGAKVGAVKKFLKTKDLNLLATGGFDVLDVSFQH